MAALARFHARDCYWGDTHDRRKMPAVQTPHRIEFDYHTHGGERFDQIDRWVRSGEASGCYRTGFMSTEQADFRYYEFSDLTTATLCKLMFL
ncbi:MAG: hypothetical protein EOP83_09975 [Verrucomicrobiaceae bacterium]|nr:MAG: hypothetical protein EOP83_09975 [Verrucomicrobiaceae bacterium]